MGRRLVYVDDGVPETGTRFLRKSCEEREVDFVPVDPRTFRFHPESQLEAGDLLYRPAISFLAQQVEQFLYAPGVATFHASDDGIYFGTTNPSLAFQRAGLPIPRTLPLHTTDRDTLADFARRLGGFPLVYKLPGYSTGMGVGQVDSMTALYSFADLIKAVGRTASLMPLIPEAVHWRLVVVGDKVAASYRNVGQSDDFRSTASTELDDYEAEPPAGMEELAVRSCEVMHLEFGGVDIVEHPPSGRMYLLENNFPCYYAQAQDRAGVDVSGAMVDHLLRKAEKLGGQG